MKHNHMGTSFSRMAKRGTFAARAVLSAAFFAGALTVKAEEVQSVLYRWGKGVFEPCALPEGVSNVTAAAAGGYHTVALKPGGTVAAWGDNSLGQCAVPPGLSNVAAVAAGDFYSMALRADGTVAVWGGMGNSDMPAPDVLTNGIAIAAGAHHSLVLKADGTVAAWGDNWRGQCNVPAGLSDVMAVAAGDLHSVALRADGTLAVWGDVVPAWMRERIGLLSGVTAVAAGGSATVAVMADGTVCLDGVQNLEDLQGAVAVAVGKDGNVYALMPDGRLAIAYEGAIPASDHPGVRIVAIDAGPMNALALGVVQAAAPAFTPAPGRLFTDRLTVTISDAVATAEIRYTLDGSEPTRASLLYTTSLVLNATAFIKAKAFVEGADDSPVVTAGYWKQAVNGRAGHVVAWGTDSHGQCAVPEGLTNAVAVSASVYHTLALTSEGQVVAWGGNVMGQCDIPEGLANVVAVAAGSTHNAALKADGTVVAWGDNWRGQCNVPPGLSNVVAVATGAYSTFALKADGTVAMWGDMSGPPAGLKDVTALSAGTYFAVALRADGTVTAWGYDMHSEMADYLAALSGVVGVAAASDGVVALKGDGTVSAWVNHFSGTDMPGGLSDVVAVAAGQGHFLALQSDGSLVAWGNTENGPCDVPAGLPPVVSFDGGAYHSVAVVSDAVVVAVPVFTPASGTVIPYGGSLAVSLDCSDEGASIRYTLDGSIPTETSPLYVAPLELSDRTVVKARAFKPDGTGSRMATATYMTQTGAGAGTVVVWGADWSGQCQVPAGLSNSVVAVAAGYAFTLALKTDGTVAAWGEGDKDGGPCAVPAGLSNVVAVAAGDYSALALRADGTVVAWGGNDSGQCNVPAGLSDVVAVASGSALSLALKRDGTVAAWGANGFGQTTVPAGLANVVAIAAGGHHAVALRADGTVVAWGESESGQCDVPKGLSDVVAITAGGSFSAALRRDGTVIQWGWDFGGSFVVPAGQTGVIAISGGKKDGVVALKSDGTVVGWGSDDYGRYDVPEWLSNVVAVAAGQTHTVALVGKVAAPQFTPASGTIIPSGGALEVTLACATEGAEIRYTLNGSDPTAQSLLYDAPLSLTATTTVKARAFISGGLFSSVRVATYRTLPPGVPVGRVVVWGDNHYGQRDVPVGLSNVVAVTAGYAFTVALKTEGAVVAWGENDVGQCDVPAGLSNVVAVSAGYHRTVALKADGTVIAWGYNGGGLVPSGLSGVVSIAAGYGHTLALKADGSMVAWGGNMFGESTLPLDLGKVVAVAAAGVHSLALTANGTVMAWGDNESGQCDVPATLSNVVAVTAGEYFSAALKSDGTVVIWGSDWGGGSSLGVPSGLSGVTAIAGGKKGHIVALKAEGTVVAWGDNDSGQCDVPEWLFNVAAIAAGQMHTVALVRQDVEPAALSVSPHEQAVAAAAGVVRFNVTNLSESVRWTASVVSGDWARVVSGVAGTNGGVVSVAYRANADGSPERQAVVQVSAVGSANAVEVTVTQAASRSMPLSEYVATHPAVPFRASGGAWYQSDAEGTDAIRSVVPSRGKTVTLTATLQGPGLLIVDWKLSGSANVTGNVLKMSLGSKTVEACLATGDYERVTLAVPSGLQKVTWTVQRGAAADEVYGCVKGAVWQPLLGVPADSAEPKNGCAMRGERITGLTWGRTPLPSGGPSGYRLYVGTSLRTMGRICETNAVFVPKEKFAALLSKAGASPLYWRVDTFVTDGRGREAVALGNVWSLAALSDDAPQFVTGANGGSSDAEPADVFPAVTLYAGLPCTVGPFAWESAPSARVTVRAFRLPPGLSIGSEGGAGVIVSGVPSAFAAGATGVTYRTGLQLVEVRNGVTRLGATAEVPITVLPLGRVAGSYTGFIDDGQNRRGLAFMTIQTSGAISGRVKLGAVDYVFSAKAFDEMLGSSYCAHIMARANKAVEPRECQVDILVSPDGTASCNFDARCDELFLFRNNWKDPDMAALLRSRYEGYYTAAVPLSDEPVSGFAPKGASYLTLTISAAGDVRLAGVLADGVAVSGSTTLLYNSDDDTAYVPVYLVPSAYKTAGSGLFVLMAVSCGAASENDPSGRKLNVLSGSGAWVNRDPWCVYGYVAGMESNRMGFAESIRVCGGYYDKTQNLQDYYAGRPLLFSGGAPFPEALDFGGRDGSTGYVLDQLPNGLAVAVSQSGSRVLKLKLPARANVYQPGTLLTDFDASTNPWDVRLEAVRATGVLSGGFRLFFASEADQAHTSKTVSLKGVLIPHRDEIWESDDQAMGFYLIPDASTYTDSQGVERRYRFNWSNGFRLSP